MLANGFVGACNTKEKGDEKASVGNIFTIHLSFLACKRTLLQDFIMLFAYFVNKDIDINSDIYDNIL